MDRAFNAFFASNALINRILSTHLVPYRIDDGTGWQSQRGSVIGRDSGPRQAQSRDKADCIAGAHAGAYHVRKWEKWRVIIFIIWIILYL